MTYELHMSGVVTGALNCFCLVCDVFLQSAHHATDHVRTSEHQNKAGAVQFSDKFPDEYIKKFKRGYYCEFCNVLMPVASKVNVHITEDEHKHNKGVLLLKPLGLDVVAFNNVLIEEKAWHGLTEGVCSLCNAEFEDEDDHKADAGHSLNLVLKPIQFGADNAIFRHLDETTVLCLTCNKLLAPGRMSKHFVDAEHLELYAKCRNEACRGTEADENCQEKANNMISVAEKDDEIKSSKIDYDVNKKIKKEDTTNAEKSSTEDKSKILESIAKYQTKGININLETEIAFCKKCSEVVTFDFNEIENHIDNHSSATEVDSDLLYPSHLDQDLNRVDIKDRTTQSSDDQHTGVMKDTLKTLRENVRDDANEEDDLYNPPIRENVRDDANEEDDLYNPPIRENVRDDANEEDDLYNPPIRENVRDDANEEDDLYNPPIRENVRDDANEEDDLYNPPIRENVRDDANEEDDLYNPPIRENVRDDANEEDDWYNPPIRENVRDDANEEDDWYNPPIRENVRDDANEEDDLYNPPIRENVRDDANEEDDLYNPPIRENVRDDANEEDDWYNPPTENDEKNSQEEARNFAKANKITYNENSRQSFCRICEVNLPGTFKSMKEHVEGSNHRRLLAAYKPSTTQPETSGNPSKKTTGEFIETSVHIETNLYIANMINTKYCISQNSLYLISEFGSRLRCLVCDMNLPPFLDAMDHARTRRHLNKWKLVPVITSQRNEFIREVRPGRYHCGFCNLVVYGWTDMKRHLECSDHIQHKTVWELRLRESVSEVEDHIRDVRQRMSTAVRSIISNLLLRAPE